MAYREDSSTLGYSVAASVAFHALLIFLYFHFVLLRPETKSVVLNNVDLILQEQEKAKTENKTLNFLKLALPQLPKVAMPEAPKMPRLAPLDIKAPESARRAPSMPQQLLEREGKVTAQEKLDMDAGRRLSGGPKDAGLDMAPERGAMAAAPRIELEEVGLRRAPKMAEGLKLDEGSGPVVRPQTMQELNMAVERAQRAVAGPQGLSEREGAVAAARRTAAVSAQPQRLAEARDAGVQLSGRQQPVLTAASISMRRGEALRQARAEDKPAMELTGPISKRKVTNYYVPQFPDWARERGILEAAVSVKFYVDNSGRVLDNAAVEATSGFGALDRLALDAIKRWRFEPIGGAPSRQWGVVTFRFVAE